MPGVVEPSPFKRITVRQIHPTLEFGGEVEGIDFKNVDDETLKEAVAAVGKYGVCIFRNTGMDDAAHVAFSERIGDLDNIKRFLQGGRKMRYQFYELFDAGNLDSENKILDPDHPRSHANRGNRLFHTDSSYNPRRASFSLLRAVELPPPGNGGNTDFADSRSAFLDLPEELQKELVNNKLVGAHTFAQSRRLGSPEFFADLEPTSFKMAKHRVAQVHEPSGRVNLYIGAHLHHVEGEGVDAKRGEELVKILNEHVGQDKYIISLQWHQPGDMIIWDNRAVLHRAVGGSFEGKHRRDLRRTTVHDDSPTAWGLNDPSEDQAAFNSYAKSVFKPDVAANVTPAVAAAT